MAVQIAIDQERLTEFCQRWKITELALFGSVLREDFGAESDIDVLVRFEPDAHWSLFDLPEIEEGLVKLFGRPVDLVCREAVEGSLNWIRRKSILSSARVIYAT